jgi:hypothetical protein
VHKAPLKLKTSYPTARYYYYVYKNNPEKKIPKLLQKCTGVNRIYIQEQITKLIKHIVDDDITILAASMKANMSYRTAPSFYNKYLEDPNHKVLVASPGKYCTQEQINELICYIVNYNLTFKDALKKILSAICK